MTSNEPSQAYVWIWLPGEASPVIAGLLTQDGPLLKFNYGQSYLKRENKISIYTKELPLRAGRIDPLAGLSMPGCIRDGAPDAWGRRVIINRKYGNTGKDIVHDDLSELTYFLESGSDRIGALDFQSGEKYQPRDMDEAPLETLLEAVELVERGNPLPIGLDRALHHGTAIGGARPKALINETDRKHIAKFSSTNDTYSVIKAEYIAMKLAALAGLNVAKVKLVKAAHKDVLLIERFDRVKANGGWARKAMVSALTMLELDENLARYASYQRLAEIVRLNFTAASATLRELFSRIVFNVLCGNTDDHARNHAAFWDGSRLTLTPAYDICPQMRTGGEANQAMSILSNERRSQIALCLDAAEEVFLLNRAEAFELVERIAHTIVNNWNSVCEEAQVSPVDRKLFQSRQFFNPYALEGLSGDEEKKLKNLKSDFEAM